MKDQDRLTEIAVELCNVSRTFYSRGWVLGTSGNFSAVVSREPFRLAISPSGAEKESLTADQILLIDQEATVVGNHLGKPSAETFLHLRIATEFGAGAVLHTHSVWSTTLSQLHAADGGITIEGYEMLKGLRGVATHEHKEWVPIIDNSQDMKTLAETVSKTLGRFPDAHGFLVRRHGLYSWGENIVEAKRHVEIIEFLLEAMGRTKTLSHEGR